MTVLHPVPEDYALLKTVHNSDELIDVQLSPAHNCFRFPRRLHEDFRPLALHLKPLCGDGVALLEEKQLIDIYDGLTDDALKIPTDRILQDMQMFGCMGMSPVLRVIGSNGYPADRSQAVFGIGAHLPHMDNASGPKGIGLIGYDDLTTINLRLEEAIRCIEQETALRKLARAFEQRTSRPAFNGAAMDEGFSNYLQAMRRFHFPRRGAKRFAFDCGDISLHAPDRHVSGAPGHVHYARRTPKGAPPRLLMQAE